MKKQNLIIIFTVLLSLISFNACIDDMNVEPLDKNVVTSELTFGKSATPYVQFLAKLYAGMSTGGIQGGDNNVDITGYDGGSQAGYLRPLWNLQELPTDEAVCCWNDQTVKNFHNLSWTKSDIFIEGFYERLYYQITVSTAFLQETTAAKLESRGVSQSLKDSITTFRAEARFLRALAYYNVLDMFRNGPMITDDSKIGYSDLPPYATSQELFDYIESELKDCKSDLLPPMVGFSSTEYGHANSAAAAALLARLYLNANTFLGTNDTKYYTSCITSCNEVIGDGYELEPIYQNLFVADNYKSKEIIFPIVFDGSKLTSWGAMMFLMCSAVDGTLQSITGAPGSWGGNRATKEFANRFESTDDDRNAILYRGYNHPSIDDVFASDNFTQGVQVLKFRQYNSAGTKSSNSFADTDFPLLRLGDVYLMYAEAVLRGGTGGSVGQALIYINKLRDRAYPLGNGEITESQLTLDFILEERAREMYWEAVRRTDLVRFGKLTSSSYTWEWKGGVKAGTATVESYRNYYPIPVTDINANPNLKQNEGYN